VQQHRASWPELPWQAWGDSLDTLHMWTQIVGKIRLALEPPSSHWWHAALFVTPRGLSTSAMPSGERLVEIEFDFLADRLRIEASDGGDAAVELAAGPVARFYADVMAALQSLELRPAIHPVPVEVAEPIPFPEDDVHVAYDPDHGRAFQRALSQAHRLLSAHRARFVGKASPVQFFWGSFDLTTTRFSGRRAPKHTGGPPNCPPWVTEEAYSHEVSAAGWWPLDRRLGPAFYSYAYPEPPGFSDATVRPTGARYDTSLREFILPYDDVRTAAHPDRAVMEFLHDTYARAADLASWPRAALEPTDYPADGPPDRAWSTSTTGLVASPPAEDQRAR